jgi:hypothetical protein
MSTKYLLCAKLYARLYGNSCECENILIIWSSYSKEDRQGTNDTDTYLARSLWHILFTELCNHHHINFKIFHHVLWLMPVILATQEAEVRRIVVWSQPGQIVPRDPISKNPSQKRAGGVAQGVGPEFKPQHQKKGFFSSPRKKFCTF